MSFLADPATAIFSVWNLESRSTDDRGRGTAAAISGDLLVTCEHVVRDAKEVTLLSHHPLFEGKNGTKGKVIGTDENLDLALLRSSSRLPFLELEDKEDLDDSIPLRIWSWPGWNAWWKAVLDQEKEIQVNASSTLTPTPRAAVMTSWTEEKNNTLRFNFAGHIEGGMSGGPVVSALNNKILGIITRDWNEDPEAILASSYLDPDSCMDDEDAQRWVELDLEKRRAAVIAQLDLGMGIALSVKELKAFLESKAPEALYPSPRPLPRGTVL